MKNVLTNPIVVNIELTVVEDVIRILGQAVHRQFAHDDIEAIKQFLLKKRQAAINSVQEPQEKTE